MMLFLCFIVGILATNSTGRCIRRKFEIQDQTLDLSNQQLTNNDLPEIFKKINGSVEIKRLDLSKNYFTSFSINVSLNLLPNFEITDIILDDNNMSEVPDNLFQFFPNVKLLSIKNNDLTKIANQFEKLNNLTKLYLDKNPIDTISRHTFIGLKNLVLLSLSNTNLTSTDERISSLLISPNVTIRFGDHYKSATVTSLPISTNDITSKAIMTTPDAITTTLEATTTTPEATTKTPYMSKSSSAYNSVSLWTTIVLIFTYLIL